MLPATPERVRASSSDTANWRIDQEISRSVRFHAAHPERIGDRLREIDQEWDIERTLEAMPPHSVWPVR